ncbi:hypothetical protein H4R19_004774 [Coemansia spiralis]|nr:hypothetical protein H4R19_004774 [Coemansia spiralis]
MATDDRCYAAIFREEAMAAHTLATENKLCQDVRERFPGMPIIVGDFDLNSAVNVDSVCEYGCWWNVYVLDLSMIAARSGIPVGESSLCYSFYVTRTQIRVVDGYGDPAFTVYAQV